MHTNTDFINLTLEQKVTFLITINATLGAVEVGARNNDETFFIVGQP